MGGSTASIAQNGLASMSMAIMTMRIAVQKPGRNQPTYLSPTTHLGRVRPRGLGLSGRKLQGAHNLFIYYLLLFFIFGGGS